MVYPTLDEAPRHGENMGWTEAGGWGMWYSRVSSHGVSWAPAGPRATLGIRLAAWPRSPGTGCGVLFRWCLLGSSGHTGPSGRSSIGFVSPLGAASSITNQCVFCWEAGHWPRRGDNGLPPLKWVSLHPSPLLSSLGEDLFLPRTKSLSLRPLSNP